MTITRLAAVGLICLAGFSTSPVRSENVEVCVECAERYLNENSSTDEEARWQVRWQQDVEQAIADNPILDENKYLNGRLINALAGKSFNSLSSKDRLLACRFYLLYRQKGMAVPEGLKAHLTDQNLQKIFGS